MCSGWLVSLHANGVGNESAFTTAISPEIAHFLFFPDYLEMGLDYCVDNHLSLSKHMLNTTNSSQCLPEMSETDMNFNKMPQTDDYLNASLPFSGQVIEFDDSSGSVLRIQPLRTHRDEAIYECTASNSVGEINTSAKLTVLEGKT